MSRAAFEREAFVDIRLPNSSVARSFDGASFSAFDFFPEGLHESLQMRRIFFSAVSYIAFAASTCVSHTKVRLGSDIVVQIKFQE